MSGLETTGRFPEALRGAPVGFELWHFTGLRILTPPVQSGEALQVYEYRDGLRPIFWGR
jgi:hypothetical protein